MTKYTAEMFEADMSQLGGMIENFYQNGGSCGPCALTGGKPSLDPNNYDVGYKMKDTEGKSWEVKEIRGVKKWVHKRRFKIYSVNGRPYDKYSSYSGAEPKIAAKRAFKFTCERLFPKKENKTKHYGCSLTFKIKEITRGSDKRVYGPYKASFKKLDKPKTFKFPGMKKSEVQTHEIVINLEKK